MRTEDLADAYLAALGRADVAGVLDLFQEGAIVHSPLYGSIPASEFYARLFGDTSGSTLTPLGSARGTAASGTPLIFIWFRFDWRLAGGQPAAFDVVDIAELSGDGRIAALHILYDTVDARPVFEKDTGRSSWRRSS